MMIAHLLKKIVKAETVGCSLASGKKTGGDGFGR